MQKTLLGAALFAAASFAAEGVGTSHASDSSETTEANMNQHPYIGMWVTGDGRIRHELLANGRYDEARGERQSAYRGRYEVRGNEIFYWDDTGFTADGTFTKEDVLHHGGMIFYREK
jgi:hypothetical protein